MASDTSLTQVLSCASKVNIIPIPLEGANHLIPPSMGGTVKMSGHGR